MTSRARSRSAIFRTWLPRSRHESVRVGLRSIEWTITTASSRSCRSACSAWLRRAPGNQSAPDMGVAPFERSAIRGLTPPLAFASSAKSHQTAADAQAAGWLQVATGRNRPLVTQLEIVLDPAEAIALAVARKPSLLLDR